MKFPKTYGMSYVTVANTHEPSRSHSVYAGKHLIEMRFEWNLRVEELVLQSYNEDKSHWPFPRD